MWKRAVLTMMVASILAPAVVFGQGKSQGRGSGSTASGKTGSEAKKSGEDAKKGGEDKKAPADVVFNRGDHDTFRDYFRTHNIKPEALPPGIAKKALPNDLVAKLGSRAQPGVSYNLVGDRVVALRDGRVIDVMEGLFGK